MTNKEKTTTYYRFRLFQIMWLIFIVFHVIISSPYWSKPGTDFLNPSHPLFMILNVVVLGLAVMGLFYPHKLKYFFLAVIGLTAIKIDSLPSVPNHIILMLLIHGTILLGWVLYRGQKLPLKERISRWFSRIAPFLRIELLLLYFFVVFHKMNYDFFNPEISCSAILYHEIGEIFPFFPQSLLIDWVNIVGTFLLELMIPILLIFRRTRLLGIIAALIFHFLLSFHPELFILSFTAEIYALLVLFLPGDLIRAIAQQLSRRRKDFRRWGAVFIALSCGIAFIYSGLLLLSYDSFSFSHFKNDLLALFQWIPFIWFGWCLLLIGWSWKQFRGRWFSRAEPINFLFTRMSYSPLWMFAFLVILNGFTPYLGLKTATNFAMFSNLKVNGEDNNHLFMPTRFQLSDLQKDTVTLQEANHPDLQLFIDNRERIPYFKLSTFLYNKRHEEISVRFSRQGQEHTISLPNDPPENWLESSWLERKLLIFRGIPESGPTPCQW